jgi:3-oxoacyl-[acyl-carrier protein] reductase
LSFGSADFAATDERPWACVLGASRGIGRATALELARRGWNLVLHHRNSPVEINHVAAEVAVAGARTRITRADFSVAERSAELERSLEEFVIDEFTATPGLRAWVHLAGADTLTGAGAKLSFADKLELLLRVDLMAAMFACRASGRLLRERGGGSIVTVGWDQSATGMEGDSGELFAAVKAGVTAFTRSLAKSLAPSVRVNCVAPGWIRTAWGEGAPAVWQERVRRETPLARWGEPDDIARAVGFLISPEASFLTGQTLCVNGGAVMT